MRNSFRDKEKIVIKIGSSSLQHKETGDLDFNKMEVLVRQLCDLRNQGKDVVLVTSGAIAVGRKAVGAKKDDIRTSIKQACSAIGQARLMMTYQKLFAEYNQVIAQILMTKYTISNDVSRTNAHNTFTELFELGVIPIVNENDTVSTDEIEIGDNDNLSAIVARLVGADLLILLSDIDGLYTDDPRKNKEAIFIEQVDDIDDRLMNMGKASTGSDVGTGGMNTKLLAAKVATSGGCDMIIANGRDIKVINQIMDGESIGTLFKSNVNNAMSIDKVIEELDKIHKL